MNNQNRIALFVDIDNMPLTKQHIDRIIAQLEQSGEIAYAKFYGVTDRRHRDIICDIAARGFEMLPPVNPKKRGSTKVFDNRILVDLCELVFTNSTISSVAIVANPTNLVHLFAKLKKEDVGIYACDNLDDDSLDFVDEILRFGYEDPNTAAKEKAAEEERDGAQGAFKIVTRRDSAAETEEAEASEEAEDQPAESQQPLYEEVKDDGREESQTDDDLQAEEEANDDRPAEEEQADEQPAVEESDDKADTDEKEPETSESQPEEIPEEETAEQRQEEEKQAEENMDILKQISQMKEDAPADDDKEDAALIEKIKKLLDEFN